VAGHAWRWRVESLDYPFAIAGVPRLVSGAEAGSAPVPCLLITQSAGFSNRHACRYRRRCGACGSQGVPAYCGMHSSRFGFFPREAPNGLPPGRIRSPLLYRLSYPVSWTLSRLRFRARLVQIPRAAAGSLPTLRLPPTARSECNPKVEFIVSRLSTDRTYIERSRATPGTRPEEMLKKYLTFPSRVS
jgi:hypothetical protein